MSSMGMDLTRFIIDEERKFSHTTGSLTLALSAVRSGAKIIGAHIRRAGLVNVIGKIGTTNVQNEEVQKLDDLSNSVLLQFLSDSGQFYALASEEMEKSVYPEQGQHGKYVISFDPLDGSSNIDSNASIGTIFSIHRKVTGTDEDFFQEGHKQVAAGYILYGSSVIMVYSTGQGVHGFTLDPTVGMFLLSHPNMKIPEEGKIYSFNESNFRKWDSRVQKFLDYLKDEKKYSLRYSGTMVSDVHRMMIKGGVFGYPADTKNPNGKLRLLYEAAPMAFLAEQAGGMATTGTQDILALKATSLHQRVPIFLGSKADIEAFVNEASP